MKKFLLSIGLSVLALGAYADSGIISSTPEGTLYPQMYGASDYTYLTTQGGFGSFEQNCGYCTSIVVDNENLYIHNIIREYPGIDSWVKGKIGEDGEVVFEFPQPVATDINTGAMLYASMMMPIESNGNVSLVPDTENPNLIMSWNGKDLIQILSGTASENLERFEGMIGLVDENGTFRSYGEQGISYTSWDIVPVTPPQELETVPFTASYTDEWNETHKLLVNMGIMGEEAWIKGLCETLPDAWIKGTIDEFGDITLLSEQFLGIANDYFYFFFAADSKDCAPGKPYEWINHTTLHASDNGYEATSSMMINLGATHPWFGTGISNLTLTSSDNSDPIPVNPIFGDPEWDENDGMGIADFYIAAEDINGEALDPSNLYYRVYFNGQLAEVAYDEEGEPILDIPFGKDYDLIIYMYDWHFVIFLEPLESIGVQSVYKLNGAEYCSEIITFEFDSTGIESFSQVDKEITDIAYFTLTGTQISQPSGICIKKVKYADGTTRSYKVILK